MPSGADRTDYARAALVLQAMERALEERAGLDRTIAEAVQASDTRGTDEAIEAAERNVAQLQALLSELDVYWPRRTDGLREEDGAPEELLELAERVRSLGDAATQDNAATTDSLREQRDRMLSGMRSIRVTRRTGTKYKVPKPAGEARMFDLRR